MKVTNTRCAKRVREQLVHRVSFTGKERNYPNRRWVKNYLKALKGKRGVMSRKAGAIETEKGAGGRMIKSIITKAMYSQHPKQQQKKKI